VFAFGTETEAERGGFLKRGETPDYRYFEVAGTAHVAASIIDFVAAPDQNPIDSTAVDRAALHNLLFLGAHFTPFGSTRLDELCPNHGAYVTRVAKAAHRLVERRENANAYIGEAAASSIGK